MNKKPVVVLDIDGVIFNTQYLLNEIYEKKLKGDERWEYFYTNCNSERTQLVKGAIELTQILFNAGITILFSTARNEKCREETINKLTRNGIVFHQIYMRKDGDLRDSSEVKREHLQEIMKEYDVTLFIDDDLSNCEMAKELGIQALRKV